MMIEAYHFGCIVINGKEYTSDVIIYPDRVDSTWWRSSGHKLYVEDLEDVLREKPDVLIVGMGDPGLMKVLPETEARLKSEGIRLIAKPTEEACSIYNKLLKGKKVIAALHLTC
ncbi:MAG: Mth938-like domain-containing protein [Candidatus Heimdallarchaeota archaeon]